MSHYRSGRYYVELEKRQAIERECQQKLQQAQQARDVVRAEGQREKQRLADNEKYLADQAQQMRRDAATDRTRLQQEAEELRRQAEQKLAQLDVAAQRLLTVYRSNLATQDLQVQVEQLHQMLILGHDPVELLKRAEEFLQKELPVWEAKLRVLDDQRVTSQSASHLSQIRATAEDHSESFVSLKKKGGKQQVIRKTPWEIFCSRVQALVDQQKDMATDELLQLVEEMERVAPNQQKLFMINNTQLLEDLEADAAAVADMISQAAEELEGQIRRYEALCGLMELVPEHRFTDRQASSQTYALLSAENDRLWQQYLLRQEEEYVDRNLEEVFEKFGIRFDNLETAAAEDGSVQMHCNLSGSTRLTMTKSSGGAFEIEFTGVTGASTASLDERRRMAAEAQSFCSLMPQVTAELASRGILIRDPYEEAPTAENIRIEHRAAQSVVYEKKALRTMK